MGPDEVHDSANAAVFDDLLKTAAAIGYEFPFDDYYTVKDGMQSLPKRLLAETLAANNK